MAKKCPPGFICFENITLIFIVIVLSVILYYYLKYIKKISTITPIDSNNKDLKHNTVYITRVDNSNLPTYPVYTQEREFVYRQVGILTRVNGPDTMLPLYGRMINTSRDKWQYYTMNDSNNSIRLPISVNGRSGSDEYGVDEIYNGDTVYVEGYNDIFKATIYKNNRFNYVPF
jgi:hypothetical protein